MFGAEEDPPSRTIATVGLQEVGSIGRPFPTLPLSVEAFVKTPRVAP